MYVHIFFIEILAPALYNAPSGDKDAIQSHTFFFYLFLFWYFSFRKCLNFFSQWVRLLLLFSSQSAIFAPLCQTVAQEVINVARWIPQLWRKHHNKSTQAQARISGQYEKRRENIGKSAQKRQNHRRRSNVWDGKLALLAHIAALIN